MAIGLVAAVVLVAILGAVLREPLVRLSDWFIRSFGLWGLFIGTISTDVSPVPLVNEPLLLFAIAGGKAAWQGWLVGASASTGAGWLGYWLGRWLGGAPLVARWLERAGL